MVDVGINEYPYLEQAAVLIFILKLARHQYLEFISTSRKHVALYPGSRGMSSILVSTSLLGIRLSHGSVFLDVLNHKTLSVGP